MKKQSGFTLIELVLVIVILGILAATAIPKFVDLSSDAEQAVAEGAVGAIQSAAVITFAQNKAAAPWTSIENNLDVSADITLGACSIVSGDCSVPVTVGSSPPLNAVIDGSLCSGC